MIRSKLLKQIWTLLLGMSLAGMLGFSSSLWAIDLQSAKSQGLVGETPSGYLAVVKNSSDSRAVVASVNNARKKYYQSIASRNNTSLQVVEILAGKKAIAKASRGHYVKSASGSWVKK
ncbi:MAG: YdbL family protein [Sulfuriflexus sp.]|nr:YdbL family protein [Sulfuriflexus sp.]